MAAQGFETHWQEPPAKPAAADPATALAATPNIWEPLDKKLDEAHSLVRFLALSVVLFVAALVCLTLANTLSRRQIFHNKFFLLGWLIEIGAMLFTVFIGIWHRQLITTLLTILWSQGWTQLILFLVPPFFLLVLLVLAYYRFGSLWYHYRRLPQYRQKELTEAKNLEAESVEID
jgi:hypothetical protein